MECCLQTSISNQQIHDPKHVFSSIVHSQCSRLRRIIVSDEVLKLRIADLCKAFISCGYPTSMVQHISNKVVNVKRDLSVLIRKESNNLRPAMAENVNQD